MRIKTFIAEDEPHSRERLRELLGDFPELSLSGEAGDGIEAVEKINSLRPELVFLDIRMPGASGFDVLEKIKVNPMVVFVTAYDNYAIKAFEENAIDYILKPVSKERLEKTVKKVVRLNNRLGDLDLRRLKQVLKGSEYPRRFIVKKGEEIRIIPEEEVYYFSSEDKYVFLHNKNGRYFFEMTLKELEESLDPDKFCRIHRSWIIALDKIKTMKKWFHGEYLVELDDHPDTVLKISRRHKGKLQEKLRF